MTPVVFGVGVTAILKSGTAKFTVSVSIGVACVNVPSVAWIVKVNVPGVEFPNVIVNGTPAAEGDAVGGAIKHVPGAPVGEHEIVTVPLYPSKAVSLPFHVTF